MGSYYSDDEIEVHVRHVRAPSPRTPPRYVKPPSPKRVYLPERTVIPEMLRPRERHPSFLSPAPGAAHDEDHSGDDNDWSEPDEIPKTAYSLHSRPKSQSGRRVLAGKRRAPKPHRREVASSEDTESRALAYADGMARQRELYRPLIGNLNRRVAEAHALAIQQRAPPPSSAPYHPYPPVIVHRPRGRGASSEFSDEEWEQTEDPYIAYLPAKYETLRRQRERDARAYIKRGLAMSQDEVRRRAELDSEAFQAASRRQRRYDLETEIEQLRREERSQRREGRTRLSKIYYDN